MKVVDILDYWNGPTSILAFDGEGVPRDFYFGCVGPKPEHFWGKVRTFYLWKLPPIGKHDGNGWAPPDVVISEADIDWGDTGYGV